MELLVRSWNVFHGNTAPPGRRGHLHDMIRLAVADGPDVLCLQELPVWALPLLDDWSGMACAHVVARRPFVLSGGLAGWITRRHQGLFRSGLAGQANAILVARRHGVESLDHARVSAPGRERRVVHAVRVAGRVVVATTHLSSPADRMDQETELRRAAAFAVERARRGEAVVLAGDLNLRAPSLPGWSGGGPGIDHVLVRGATATPLRIWPRARRMQNGAVLSDHAPVELDVLPP